ncbi:MAG: hypothetical protein JOZ47_04525 [Kutzneria sp.]|nr:hypothetical protein [Kutzneria sp.]MBV9844323.1 hypothetical protein [Kutzneria sp.]
MGGTGLIRLGRLLSTPGWPRTALLRRLTAGLLVVAAVVLAVASIHRERDRTVSVLVTARDVAAGATLVTDDVRVAELAVSSVPTGALHEREAVLGRVLTGAARAGEPITDVRLVGAENTRLSTGAPNSSAVPVRLSDPSVADLLRPGCRADVIGLDTRGDVAAMLAADAVVITVRPPVSSTDKGRLVVVALPRETATKVAAASLSQPVTVTLR